MIKEFGLIGKSLRHSFSATFFTEKFVREHVEATYSLFQLDNIDAFPTLVAGHHLSGLNVTNPYKEAIIPFLDEIDPIAQEIGAVNVVKFSGEKMIGYNTDYCGFATALKPLINNAECLSALVLGTGGAAKAVGYALTALSYSVTYVSRHKHSQNIIAYDEIDLSKYTLIVNATPIGMYPNTDDFPPIDYNQLNNRHLLFDCIYNPAETLFLKYGKANGARISNGMEMLINQAEQAWDLWNK